MFIGVSHWSLGIYLHLNGSYWKLARASVHYMQSVSFVLLVSGQRNFKRFNWKQLLLWKGDGRKEYLRHAKRETECLYCVCGYWQHASEDHLLFFCCLNSPLMCTGAYISQNTMNITETKLCWHLFQWSLHCIYFKLYSVCQESMS